MSKIKSIRGLEILDSRCRPTVKAYCELENGVTASASVPSGASTGMAEAIELRDGDSSRYNGKGCLNAAKNLTETINSAAAGKEFSSQQEWDNLLLELDGTENKSNLGGNTLLAGSVAFARAVALEKKIPLYQHFSEMLGSEINMFPRMTIIYLVAGSMRVNKFRYRMF